MMRLSLSKGGRRGGFLEMVGGEGGGGAGVQWLSLNDFANVPEVVEDGATFEQNARKKAIGYAAATGVWTIADDSGLVIDALDGAPGVMSARFSGEPPKGSGRQILDHRNMAKVLKLMEGVPAEKRTARFVCNICLAAPEGVLAQTEGKLEGLIATAEAGTNGFGYDPIFFVPALNSTAAQLTSAEKNEISHRGRAIKEVEPLLQALLTSL
ncbi:MAG: RdgB/HAM1 family non-canonical purine NTP pyrophosphatase, partial [Planctomycetes bacterium]|nr:RdgB/HAM1 family non-canonical purine NTP pyrophosphatase [Planctomycetota bacterium]